MSERLMLHIIFACMLGAVFARGAIGADPTVFPPRLVTLVNPYPPGSLADSGKLTFGSPGQGSQFHLALERLKLVSGTDIVHVPYRVRHLRSPT